VAELAFLVLTNLKDPRKQPLPDSTHSAELFGDLRTPVQIVRVVEDLLGFFKADAALWVLPQSLALARIAVKPRGITGIP
jgi:hypothetical protein